MHQSGKDSPNQPLESRLEQLEQSLKTKDEQIAALERENHEKNREIARLRALLGETPAEDELTSNGNFDDLPIVGDLHPTSGSDAKPHEDEPTPAGTEIPELSAPSDTSHQPTGEAIGTASDDEKPEEVETSSDEPEQETQEDPVWAEIQKLAKEIKVVNRYTIYSFSDNKQSIKATKAIAALIEERFETPIPPESFNRLTQELAPEKMFMVANFSEALLDIYRNSEFDRQRLSIHSDEFIYTCFLAKSLDQDNFDKHLSTFSPYKWQEQLKDQPVLGDYYWLVYLLEGLTDERQRLILQSISTNLQLTPNQQRQVMDVLTSDSTRSLFQTKVKPISKSRLEQDLMGFIRIWDCLMETAQIEDPGKKKSEQKRLMQTIILIENLHDLPLPMLIELTKILHRDNYPLLQGCYFRYIANTGELISVARQVPAAFKPQLIEFCLDVYDMRFNRIQINEAADIQALVCEFGEKAFELLKAIRANLVDAWRNPNAHSIRSPGNKIHEFDDHYAKAIIMISEEGQAPELQSKLPYQLLCFPYLNFNTYTQLVAHFNFSELFDLDFLKQVVNTKIAADLLLNQGMMEQIPDADRCDVVTSLFSDENGSELHTLETTQVQGLIDAMPDEPAKQRLADMYHSETDLRGDYRYDFYWVGSSLMERLKEIFVHRIDWDPSCWRNRMFLSSEQESNMRRSKFVVSELLFLIDDAKYEEINKGKNGAIYKNKYYFFRYLLYVFCPNSFVLQEKNVGHYWINGVITTGLTSFLQLYDDLAYRGRILSAMIKGSAFLKKDDDLVISIADNKLGLNGLGGAAYTSMLTQAQIAELLSLFQEDQEVQARVALQFIFSNFGQKILSKTQLTQAMNHYINTQELQHEKMTERLCLHIVLVNLHAQIPEDKIAIPYELVALLSKEQLIKPEIADHLAENIDALDFQQFNSVLVEKGVSTEQLANATPVAEEDGPRANFFRLSAAWRERSNSNDFTSRVKLGLGLSRRKSAQQRIEQCNDIETLINTLVEELGNSGESGFGVLAHEVAAELSDETSRDAYLNNPEDVKTLLKIYLARVLSNEMIQKPVVGSTKQEKTNPTGKTAVILYAAYYWFDAHPEATEFAVAAGGDEEEKVEDSRNGYLRALTHRLINNEDFSQAYHLLGASPEEIETLRQAAEQAAKDESEKNKAREQAADPAHYVGPAAVAPQPVPPKGKQQEVDPATYIPSGAHAPGAVIDGQGAVVVPPSAPVLPATAVVVDPPSDDEPSTDGDDSPDEGKSPTQEDGVPVTALIAHGVVAVPVPSEIPVAEPLPDQEESKERHSGHDSTL